MILNEEKRRRETRIERAWDISRDFQRQGYSKWSCYQGYDVNVPLCLLLPIFWSSSSQSMHQKKKVFREIWGRLGRCDFKKGRELSELSAKNQNIQTGSRIFTLLLLLLFSWEYKNIKHLGICWNLEDDYLGLTQTMKWEFQSMLITS